MKKCVLWIYLVVLLLMGIFAGYFILGQSNHKSESRYEQFVQRRNHYSFSNQEDLNAPTGKKYVCRWKLEDIPKNGAAYTFYAVHQNVYYYVGDELAAYLETNGKNRFGHTTFSDWATVFISQEDEGKELRLEIMPTYSTVENLPQEFYYGDYSLIRRTIILKNIPVLILGILLALIGIGFVGFGLVARKNAAVDKGLLSLGVFSICAGIWKLSDMRAAPMLFGHAQGIGFISICVLPLIVVPYLNFIAAQCRIKHSLLWNVTGILSVIQCAMVGILQFFNILDVRQSLISSHLAIAIGILMVIVLISIESRYSKWSTKLTVSLICSLLCVIGAIVDLLIYYVVGDSGNVIFCLVAFIVYTICMGYLSVKETKQLMDLGREAQHFEHIAMHDSLTGLYSRSFYHEYLSQHNFERPDCSIIMFDMNHLKKSNDTFGHEFGDERLKTFGTILKEIFQDVGEVCRFGGDEFCVLINQKNADEWMPRLDTYNEKVRLYNIAAASSIPLSAAYGYASFDTEEDEDFSNTVRRADKMMYQMKVLMKMERKEEK